MNTEGAEAIVRASEPLWVAMEEVGGLVDSWGGGEFCYLFPKMCAVLKSKADSRRRDGEPEPPQALSIGAMYGGSTAVDEAWMPEIQRLMQQVMTLRRNVEDPLCVNVVFHVDGELLPPIDWVGVRTGRLSRKTMLLMVQAAVPPDPVGDRRGLLVGLLRDAVDEAVALAKRRKIADDLPGIRGIVDALSKD